MEVFGTVTRQTPCWRDRCTGGVYEKKRGEKGERMCGGGCCKECCRCWKRLAIVFDVGGGWLAVYVWAIEREEVGRKMEGGKEDSVATTEASNARTHHPSRPKQSPAGHETPVFQEQRPHPNTPATSYPFQMKSIQVYSPHKAQVFACTRPSSLSDVVVFRKYSLQ